MSSELRHRRIEFARQLEARGEIEAAARTFAEVGEVDEAARVMMAASRFGDAARLLVLSLGVAISDVGKLGVEGRRRAQKAAVCFARDGEAKTSVELFLALGDPVRAAEVLERAGDRVGAARLLQRAQVGRSSAPPAAVAESWLDAAKRLEASGQYEEAASLFLRQKRLGDAARCLHHAGRSVDAGSLYQDAGQMYEAAWCFFQAGETGRFLEAVSRVARTHPAYRKAVVEAARTASSLGVLDFQLDNFFSAFIATLPEDDAEAEALYQLGRLYEAHDYADSARDIYSRLSSFRPRFRDVTRRLHALSQGQGGSSMVDAKIRREDDAFYGAAQAAPREAPRESLFPGLPDLPDLPPLPGGIEPAKTVGISHSAFADPTAAREGAKGSLIAGRYRIESKLGEGGMAVVYRAFDLELEEEVAIKLFLSDTDDAELLQRFRQELAVCRQISHPNVVRLFDIGTHESRKFISMELLSGQDLAACMEEGKPMELFRAVHYLVQACAGLSAAHERGVVHRDVKPENFFVTNDNVLKVMDFGIAKRSESHGLTRAGFMAGTPEYMAPEQIQDFGNVTHLADVYALGIVAYKLFTGRVPFTHDELVPLLMMHVNDAPPPLRSVNPDLPEEIDDLVLRLLAKQPSERIQSCRELSRELRAIMR